MVHGHHQQHFIDAVKNVCIWYFRAPLPVLSYPDYFAFVTTEFRVKPIYTAIQEYTQGKTSP